MASLVDRKLEVLLKTSILLYWIYESQQDNDHVSSS